MPAKVKAVIALVWAAGLTSLWWAAQTGVQDWLRFSIYLAAVLLSAGMKVPMPSGEGTLSVNFPFILLGIVQLTPLEALALSAVSVFAQCRIRVANGFTFVQIAFNVANAVMATAVAYQVLALTTHRIHEMAPALCVAMVAYFFANSITISLVIGWSTRQHPFRLWLREFPWYLPFYLVGAIVAAAADMASRRFGLATSMLLIPIIYVIYRGYQTHTMSLRQHQRHLDETEALHLRTIEGLAMAIEAKDQNTHDHLLRVRVYVAEIAQAMGLAPLEQQALMTAAFLHDIGKLAVPEHIVNKPGKLTHEEFEKMKIHPVVGADILERMRFPYPVAPIVRAHHEFWDGTGYPDGLAGEAIPIGARILSVVDCFDALASDRPYRKAVPLAAAMAHVKQRAGTQFDPRVVAVLAGRCEQMEARAREQRGAITPLKTAEPIWRGHAPGTGLAQDTDHAATDPERFWSDAPGEDRTRPAAMKLIAAASQEAQTLFEMGQMLGSSLSPNETISVMSSRLKQLIPFQCFALYLCHDDVLLTQYIDGDCAQAFSKSLIRQGEGLSGWVAQSGKPILNGNPRLEPNYAPERTGEGIPELVAEGHPGHLSNDGPNDRPSDRPDHNLGPDPDAVSDHAAAAPMLSALSLPLVDLAGAVFGVLTLYSAQPEAFSRDHLRIVQAVETKFSLSLENALRFRSAEKQASIDYITQLPNMRQFFLGAEVQLDRARRTGEGLGVVVCDLDAFKDVNDRHGHLTGNTFLRGIAEGFRKICRSYDVVARMGGDEFVFLMPDVDHDSCAAQLAAIAAVVETACSQHRLEVHVSVSVGVAFFPEDGATAEELLGQADRRMYLHKRDHYDAVGVEPIAIAGKPVLAA